MVSRDTVRPDLRTHSGPQRGSAGTGCGGKPRHPRPLSFDGLLLVGRCVAMRRPSFVVRLGIAFVIGPALVSARADDICFAGDPEAGRGRDRRGQEVQGIRPKPVCRSTSGARPSTKIAKPVTSVTERVAALAPALWSRNSNDALPFPSRSLAVVGSLTLQQ